MNEIIKFSSVFCLVLAICGCRYMGEIEVEENSAESVSTEAERAQRETERQRLETDKQPYVEDLKGIIRDFPVNDPEADSLFRPGGSLVTAESSFKGECIYKDKRFVSYRMTSYAYRGGAHGNTSILVGILDRVTGEPKRWRDIVPEKDWAAFEKKVIQAAKDELKRRNTEPLAPLFVTENVYIDEKGLHFVYNEYEIACYAVGAVEVTVPLSDK